MKASKSVFLFALSFLIPLLSINLSGQEDINPRLSLSYLKKGDSERILKVRSTVRVDRQLILVSGVRVNFYHTEAIDENHLGHAVTDVDGNGQFLIPESFDEIADTTNYYIFIAAIQDQSGYRDVERDIEIIDARLILDFEEIDSIKTATVTVLERGEDGDEIPVEEAEVKVFVKRPFGDLPITKESEWSDEMGMIEVEFPNDLPGDQNGNLIVIARVEDSDGYGSLETIREIDWGLIPHFDDDTTKRSLWAAGANAPLELLFFVNALIIATWGLIFYIGFQILKIRKLNNNSN